MISDRYYLLFKFMRMARRYAQGNEKHIIDGFNQAYDMLPEEVKKADQKVFEYIVFPDFPYVSEEKHGRTGTNL